MPVTNYIWDTLSDNVLMETDGSGTTTAVYTHEPDLYGNLISQRRGSQTSYYHFDGLGSTRELTNASETVTDTNMYDAWGVNIASTGTTENPFRWVGETGYYHDPETEDYYIRARLYNSTIALWSSSDPMWQAFWPSGYSAYLYSNNSPVSTTDPSGLIPPLLVGIALASGAVSTCAAPQAIAAHNRYPASGDKFKHCWTSCRVGKVCGAHVVHSASLGKEVIDSFKRLVGDKRVGDWLDSLQDMQANLACLYPEAYIPPANLIGALCRESCEQCCRREVGFKNRKDQQ